MILSRSFSKAYGLAGLRIGYGVAQPALTDLLNRIRQPFNVNSLAQAAAIAAFQDSAFLQQGFELNRAGFAQLTQAFDALGLSLSPSAGNFVLVKVGEDDGAGARINLELLKRGAGSLFAQLEITACHNGCVFRLACLKKMQPLLLRLKIFWQSSSSIANRQISSSNGHH